MRASASALFSFAATAAATLSGHPPEGNIVLTVGAGSSLEGYQLVGYYNNGAGFPELVPAAVASQSQQPEWFLKWWNFGHFAWYAITSDIDSATYQLDIEPTGAYTGTFVLNPQTSYYSSDDIWYPSDDSPVFPWFGNSDNSAHACTRDDGRLQLAVYGEGDRPKNCEQIQLEYHLLA
ncbi:hypothetical protein F4802DRAFT_599740 [Xylaria palmicola]|nr:hypothetical protein F4802DRAFT_599740 [Xylaria palmicola]